MDRREHAETPGRMTDSIEHCWRYSAVRPPRTRFPGGRFRRESRVDRKRNRNPRNGFHSPTRTQGARGGRPRNGTERRRANSRSRTVRTEGTVTRSVAPVRGNPDDDAEQVTQVLYGARVEVFDSDNDGGDGNDGGDWSRVLTPDGYLGWVNGTRSSQ